MAKKRWNEISTTAKVAIVAVAAVDGGLRAWALRDLSARTQDEINGPKRLWAFGLSGLTTAGVLPLLYLARGRKSV